MLALISMLAAVVAGPPHPASACVQELKLRQRGGVVWSLRLAPRLETLDPGHADGACPGEAWMQIEDARGAQVASVEVRFAQFGHVLGAAGRFSPFPLGPDFDGLSFDVSHGPSMATGTQGWTSRTISVIDLPAAELRGIGLETESNAGKYGCGGEGQATDHCSTSRSVLTAMHPDARGWFAFQKTTQASEVEKVPVPSSGPFPVLELRRTETITETCRFEPQGARYFCEKSADDQVQTASLPERTLNTDAPGEAPPSTTPSPAATPPPASAP